LSLSSEREFPGEKPVVILPNGVFADTSEVLMGRYQDHHVTRINALAGFRHIEFKRVTGFETLEAQQDIGFGEEVALIIGKGFQALGGVDSDMFLSTDIYLATGHERSFAAFEITGEGRRPSSGRWDGILSSGRVAYFNRPAERHSFIASAEWTGGWRVRLPFQLALNDREGGMLGYRRSLAAGSRRLITSLEERYHLGRIGPWASLSGAAFVETGRLWAGHAPFGTTTPTAATVGVSLLAALPPRSHRLSRLDIAIPLNAGLAGSKWQIRFTNSDLTRIFWREPNDLHFHRERSVPTSIFNYP
jgi:hypothetical protein